MSIKTRSSYPKPKTNEPKWKECKNRAGESELMQACNKTRQEESSKQEKLINEFEKCLKDGNPNSIDNAKNTVASVAVLHYQSEMFQRLLEKGANVDLHSGNEGNLVIHDILLMMFENTRRANILNPELRPYVVSMFKTAIDYGADMNVKNKIGETGLSLLEKLESVVEAEEVTIDGKVNIKITEVEEMRRYYMNSIPNQREESGHEDIRNNRDINRNVADEEPGKSKKRTEEMLEVDEASKILPIPELQPNSETDILTKVVLDYNEMLDIRKRSSCAPQLLSLQKETRDFADTTIPAEGIEENAYNLKTDAGSLTTFVQPQGIPAGLEYDMPNSLQKSIGVDKAKVKLELIPEESLGEVGNYLPSSYKLVMNHDLDDNRKMKHYLQHVPEEIVPDEYHLKRAKKLEASNFPVSSDTGTPYHQPADTKVKTPMSFDADFLNIPPSSIHSNLSQTSQQLFEQAKLPLPHINYSDLYNPLDPQNWNSQYHLYPSNQTSQASGMPHLATSPPTSNLGLPPQVPNFSLTHINNPTFEYYPIPPVFPHNSSFFPISSNTNNYPQVFSLQPPIANQSPLQNLALLNQMNSIIPNPIPKSPF